MARSPNNVSFEINEKGNFENQKNDHRKQLEDRMKIQRRIEAMRREYEFISKLDTNDVTYILEKKREQAAIMIQRKYRQMKARKELKERRQGLFKLEDE